MEEGPDDVLKEFTWAKLQNSAHSIGFREGLSVGKEVKMQEGFDTGYKSGYRTSRHVGVIRGMVGALLLKESNNSVLCDKFNKLLEKLQ